MRIVYKTKTQYLAFSKLWVQYNPRIVNMAPTCCGLIMVDFTHIRLGYFTGIGAIIVK